MPPAYFPALYARVTARIGRSILDGRFERPEQMELFAARFAAYYIEAWRGRFTMPRCWRAAADVAGKRELLIVQHLLLGINAHVNHDLPLAVVAAADVRGNLAAARADFDAVNDVLADTFGDVLDDLDRVSRWTNEAAALGGGRLFNFSLRVARRQAWGAAERLHRLDAAERERYTIELDRMVTVLAYLVTPPESSGSAARLARPAAGRGRSEDRHDRLARRRPLRRPPHRRSTTTGPAVP